MLKQEIAFIPTGIVVGPYEIDVFFQASFFNEAKELAKLDGNIYGIFSPRRMAIYLDCTMPLVIVQEALWHEIGHATTMVTGDYDRKLSEEEWLLTIVPLQIWVLKNNPILVHFLTLKGQG